MIKITPNKQSISRTIDLPEIEKKATSPPEGRGRGRYVLQFQNEFYKFSLVQLKYKRHGMQVGGGPWNKKGLE